VFESVGADAGEPVEPFGSVGDGSGVDGGSGAVDEPDE
jgi:hypothetical protein